MSDEEKIALARLEEKVTGWMETTTEYRKELCRKITELKNKVSDMPCREHIKTFEYLTNSIKLIYIILGIIVAFIVKVHLGG